jgi:hypothetical protein
MYEYLLDKGARTGVLKILRVDVARRTLYSTVQTKSGWMSSEHICLHRSTCRVVLVPLSVIAAVFGLRPPSQTCYPSAQSKIIHYYRIRLLALQQLIVYTLQSAFCILLSISSFFLR